MVSYGTVIVRDGTRLLIHENGFTQQETVTAERPDLRFQTFFGPSQLQFRLASLRPFEIDVDFPDDAEGLLRFIGYQPHLRRHERNHARDHRTRFGAG